MGTVSCNSKQKLFLRRRFEKGSESNWIFRGGRDRLRWECPERLYGAGLFELALSDTGHLDLRRSGISKQKHRSGRIRGDKEIVCGHFD